MLIRLFKRVGKRLFEGTPLEYAARVVWSYVNPRTMEVFGERRDNALIFSIVARLLRENSNAVDVGANEGVLLAAMVAQAPHGRHAAFEPIPELAAKLRARHPNVEVIEAALSDAAGEATFRIVPESSGYSSLLDHPLPAGMSVRELRVRVSRLDDELPPDRAIALIKVDVEGAELNVFRGAPRTLNTYAPPVIFEFGTTNATPPAEMVTILHDELGYDISRLDDWLAGRPPLTAETFAAAVRSGRYWNFIAHRA